MIVLRTPEILNTDLEWLEPNGLGGYAASSLTGKNTRREHGLLVAARRPPEGRVVLLSRLDERLSEGAHHYDLASIQFPGHTTDGARFLTEARMDLFPVFRYRAGNITLEKTIAAIHAEDTVIIRYSIHADELAGLPHLDLRPFAACRPADTLRKNQPETQDEFKLRVGRDWVCVESEAGMPLWIHALQCSMHAEPDWHYNFEYKSDAEHGRPFQEDLFTPGILRFGVGISEIYVIISAQDPRERSARDLFEKEKTRREALSETASRLLSYGTVTAGNASWETIKSNMVHHLALSLDQHIVWRLDGRSALAGYHTLPDRVRDTLVAIPGITLLRGKETAGRILRLFARHARSGRIPSGFDAAGAPRYDAVDTGFWFILALYRYQEITSDSSLVSELMPAVRAIMGAVQKGRTSLVVTGALPFLVSPGGTYMEEGHAWRSGYVVEVCALYYNALRVFSEMLRGLGHDARAERMYHESEIAKRAFREKFWFGDEKRLYDAVWPDRRDRSLRPSQILALSLPFALFEGEEAIGILSAAGRLATDRGLRTLSPDDPGFRDGLFPTEGEAMRLGATVPWLLVPYLSALCALRGEPGRMQAREILTRFYAHLSEGVIGSVSGVFASDGRPAGSASSLTAAAELFRMLCEEV